MGSRRNGWIWRDDLDRLRHLLRRIVAEVSYIAHVCNRLGFRGCPQKLADTVFVWIRDDWILQGSDPWQWSPWVRTILFLPWWHLPGWQPLHLIFNDMICRRVSSKMVRWVVLGCTQVDKQVCFCLSAPPDWLTQTQTSALISFLWKIWSRSSGKKPGFICS